MNTTGEGSQWPPEIPDRADYGSVPVAHDEADVAGHLLGLIWPDYRYATDLRTWIMRDGERWVPAPGGIAPMVADVADASVLNPLLDDPRVQKWARQNPNSTQAYEVPTWGGEGNRFGIDDVWTHNMTRRLRTPAGQNRIAALMTTMANRADDEGSVRAGELDADPGVLWAGGVPFDLAGSADGVKMAGSVRDRRDMNSLMVRPHMMSAGYCPDPSVTTPLWHELLAAVFPDPAERDHVLDALAHGFHGYPSAESILARSATGLGKSLLATLISDLLGDYAGRVSARTLFGRSSNSQFAFAEVGPARFVVMNEGQKADFASTEAFKSFVNPDPLVDARERHERNPRKMPAHHTVFLTINPAADLDYSDPAVVRRLTPTGFAGDPGRIAAIAAKYGTSSAEGLANWTAEAPGVMAQMIMRCGYVLGDPANRGTRADAPASVMSRFDDVAAEADPFGRWLRERTTDGPATSTDDLMADHDQWCRDHRIDALDRTWFGRALASAGIERCKLDRVTRGWRVALLP